MNLEEIVLYEFEMFINHGVLWIWNIHKPWGFQQKWLIVEFSNLITDIPLQFNLMLHRTSIEDRFPIIINKGILCTHRTTSDFVAFMISVSVTDFGTASPVTKLKCSSAIPCSGGEDSTQKNTNKQDDMRNYLQDWAFLVDRPQCNCIPDSSTSITWYITVDLNVGCQILAQVVVDQSRPWMNSLEDTGGNDKFPMW